MTLTTLMTLLSVSDPSAVLEIHAWDKDKYKKDDHLGRCVRAYSQVVVVAIVMVMVMVIVIV